MKTLALFLVAAVLSPTAQAYVPPSSYLVQQMAKKHSKLKGLRVKTRLTGTSNQLKEIFWLDRTSKVIKGRFLDANDQEVYAYSRVLNENDSLAFLVLFESDPSKLSRALIAQGIPVITDDVLTKLPTPEERRAVEKTGIARLNGQVAWKIGTESPSLWLLKDEFTPLKLVPKSGVEIRFEETKSIREFPYSRAITLLQGNSFVLKGEAMEVMVNPDLSDMKKITTQGLPPIPSDLDSASRSLIENWIQWIR